MHRNTAPSILGFAGLALLAFFATSSAYAAPARASKPIAARLHGQSPRAPVTGTVNVNTATAKELALLPGVGKSTAERIIAVRARRPFSKLRHLRRVRGIGKKRALALKPFITFSGKTTIQRTKAPRSKRKEAKK